MTGEADRFASAYTALRAREGWAERDRIRRAGAVADAVALIRRELGASARIVDVGSGAIRVPGVIGVDLVAGADVRGDMRALPFADSSVDGLMYAASLHYATAEDAVAEAARILRRGGILVAIDSPIYSTGNAAAAAKSRTAAYYASAGFPELSPHYHPIELGALRRSLAMNGLEVERISTGSRWRRLLRRGPTSFVLARKLR